MNRFSSIFLVVSMVASGWCLAADKSYVLISEYSDAGSDKPISVEALLGFEYPRYGELDHEFKNAEGQSEPGNVIINMHGWLRDQLQ